MDWRQIDKIIYINLASRVDRKIQILDELKRLQAPEEKILRFEAITHDLPFIGCALSHRAVLEICIENGWNRVLIIEDDMQFSNNDSDILRLETALKTLDSVEWDVFFPSSNYFSISKTTYGNDIFRVHSAFTTHCYIVNQNYFVALYKTACSCVANLLKDKRESDSIDVFYGQLMKDDNWLGLYPLVGFQRSGYSDLRKGVINYTGLYDDGKLMKDFGFL